MLGQQINSVREANLILTCFCMQLTLTTLLPLNNLTLLPSTVPTVCHSGPKQANWASPLKSLPPWSQPLRIRKPCKPMVCTLPGKNTSASRLTKDLSTARRAKTASTPSRQSRPSLSPIPRDLCRLLLRPLWSKRWPITSSVSAINGSKSIDCGFVGHVM